MASRRMTLDQIAAENPAIDRGKIDRTTEADIRRQTIEDGQDPDEDLSAVTLVSPRAIRTRLGMTQTRFAAALHIPVATLRNWEQNRVTLDPAARSLLTIVAKNPTAALMALGSI